MQDQVDDQSEILAALERDIAREREEIAGLRERTRVMDMEVASWQFAQPRRSLEARAEGGVAMLLFFQTFFVTTLVGIAVSLGAHP